MQLYRVYGKWYHREESGYFDQVVRARSPRAALYRAARCLSGADRPSEIEWESHKPRATQLGRLDPQPAFWAGADRIYQVRKIARVKAVEIECPTCQGRGRVQGYIDADSL